jgi:broad specificity phosphatase PhoE
MKVFLIRHGLAGHNVGFNQVGESAYFDPKYFDAELVPEGETQAQNAGLKLLDIKFDSIYCSPSKRCIQTLDNLLSTSKVIIDSAFKAPKNEFIILDDRLMEPQGVHIPNKRHEKVQVEKFVTNFNKKFDLSNVALNYDFNKESTVQINNKIISFINDLKTKHNKDVNILVVTHHDWLKHFFSIFFGKVVSFDNCEIRMVEM